jgi:DNA polymerase III epsilon subunit-like protein
MNTNEIFISVDVEASGPIPGEYSMLSLGACVVGATHQRFYVELKPITRNFVPEAISVAGFSLDDLEQRGSEPALAMLDFEKWIRAVTPPAHAPIFVAYPLAFDWMFVAYYFHRFLNRNPFGISGIDVKSYYAGMMGTPYRASGKEDMEPQFLADMPLTHNALEDAIVQADLFARLLAHRGKLL